MTDREVFLHEGDLGHDAFYELKVMGKAAGLAVDIETTGLSQRESQIGVVTLATPERIDVLRIDQTRRPGMLCALLDNGSIEKIFHHALFDVSFLRSKWEVQVDPVFCTKVAARIAGIEKNPTLASLVAHFLDVKLDKTERLSDWTMWPLTDAQLSYVTQDVAFLHHLQRELIWRLSDAGKTQLYRACMGFLPPRVDLEIEGLSDVFAYELKS